MLRIPEDIVASQAHPALEVPEAAVVDYRVTRGLHGSHVLVHKPTFVLVRAGIKQLLPQGASAPLVGPSGTLIAMRSGIHVMTELHGATGDYSSVLVAVDRTFLREIAGVPEDVDEGPSVAMTAIEPPLARRFEAARASLAASATPVDRQFVIRDLIVRAMQEPALRQLVYREVVDWGHTVDDRLRGVVNQHCLAPLQVSELASLCAMSVSTFKRHFKRVYGTSPAAWLTRVRLKHARALLLNSDRSVSEIGEVSGYRDVSTFIRAFRRAFGTTPNGYRRPRP